MHPLQTLQLPPSVLCLLKPPGKGPAKGYAQSFPQRIPCLEGGCQLLCPWGFPSWASPEAVRGSCGLGAARAALQPFPLCDLDWELMCQIVYGQLLVRNCVETGVAKVIRWSPSHQNGCCLQGHGCWLRATRICIL